MEKEQKELWVSKLMNLADQYAWVDYRMGIYSDNATESEWIDLRRESKDAGDSLRKAIEESLSQ